MPGLMPIHRLLAQIDDNPIEGAKVAQKRYRDGVRNATYESSVSAGALYRKLKMSKPLQGAFYSLSFWENANARDPKHLNKHCHQFVYDAREGSEGKRAEDHAAATQSYYDDESKTLEQILEALKKGGFDGFKKAKSAQDSRLQQKGMEAAERKRTNAEDGAKDNEDGGEAPKRKSSSSAGGDPPKPRSPKLTMSEVFKHLLVAMEPSELANFLADRSEAGDQWEIVVERDIDDAASGMLVWRAVSCEKVIAQ